MHRRADDRYSVYNRPVGIRAWLEAERIPADDWVMLLDPDMLLLRPLTDPVDVFVGSGATRTVHLRQIPPGVVPGTGGLRDWPGTLKKRLGVSRMAFVGSDSTSTVHIGSLPRKYVHSHEL